jgi:hypothetical protein
VSAATLGPDLVSGLLGTEASTSAATPGVSVADLTDTPARASVEPGVVPQAPSSPSAPSFSVTGSGSAELPSGVASLFNPRSAPAGLAAPSSPADTPDAGLPAALAPAGASSGARDLARTVVSATFGVDATSALLVAQCSSGLDPALVSAPDAAGVRRWGLFQIADNGPLQALLSSSGRDPLVLEAALDPAWNASAARTIASASGWAPWACAAPFELPGLTPPPAPVEVPAPQDPALPTAPATPPASAAPTPSTDVIPDGVQAPVLRPQGLSATSAPETAPEPSATTAP